MASLKEIRAKVTSIKSTQKITRAMQMVAASKMRRAQERMEVGRPYSENMRRVVSHLVNASSDYKHPYMTNRQVNRVGYILVSSDRGLAGGLNINLFKQLMHHVKEFQDQSVEAEFAVIGSKGVSFFKSFGGKVTSAVTDYGDNPTFEQLNAPVQAMLDDYTNGRLDRIFVVYNKFVNAMTQKPIINQLVPLPNEAVDSSSGIQTELSWDYIYEPDVKTLIDGLLGRYIESIVYQAVMENIASEQSARMVAMKAATDNAGDLINDLQLVYNKLRQAAITREISEIVGGAAAVS
ncbi:F0F1 ATP synthase subunit gamma [Psychrobacter sanguinis]|uniref:F0F1 ATP synthase subunit gamma n=1 Tax=Psychrobacter sanguinis TaxID=861445 RepID=UPI00020C97C8|nr:F0F1 ATP synthase subunit gamma [Psychrobacter sanguinis]EGK13652.1 ATP synthase F1 sector gamma subunit [Psychrobacter sp. 1501(2011)]MCC3308837.1 F0F1 ATP synthase subunit gamma [Psychrobacter sanguinis]MCD9150459.1 F0F1 ATP synthase subunit gamma [Psychrobacter sanguinis]MDY3306293.1 F0F1 ATP synthase subunit gamma [Psychrobacter sanguinis]UEC26129.1 F0F1 ATP synthase subunit gamma [Psychrobacter sanguinis]